MATIALARRLTRACPAGGDGQTESRDVALLMLDPLGATLRLFCPAGPRTPRCPPRPQHRAANRDDWPGLMGRLPPSTGLLLVLDTTGRQHRLVPESAPPPAVIVVTTPDSGGRLAGYRRLKELDRDRVGDVGLFFVQSPASAEPAAGPVEPLAERARAAFDRLAGAAGQFLNRRPAFLGSVAGPSAEAPATVDLLGQRPSIDGIENRPDLTRWLADNAQPMPCEAVAEPMPRPAAEPPSPAESPPPEPTQAQAEPGGPPPGLEPPLQYVPPQTAPPPQVHQPADTQRSVPADGPRPLPVLPLAAWPANDQEWSALLVRNAGFLWPGLIVLDFRPPADPPTLLAIDPPTGQLVAMRFGSSVAWPAALAALSAVVQWAHDHWPLLRAAYGAAGLAAEPNVQPILVTEEAAGAVLSLARAMAFPARVFGLVRLDLAALGQSAVPHGAALEEAR